MFTSDNYQVQSFGISSEVIAEDGSFSIEYVPNHWGMGQGSEDMVVKRCFAMDASGNESALYSSNSDLYALYFVFTEEAEIYAEDLYDWSSSNNLFFFLDKKPIFPAALKMLEVINLDESHGGLTQTFLTT